MRLSGPWKLRGATVLAAAALGGCPVRTPPPPAHPPAALPAPAPHLGAPYAIVPGQSELLILVYRAGALASAGHNHLIASHDLGGTFYVPREPLQASFEITVPVTSLTVDEEPPSTAATFRPGCRTARAAARAPTC